MRRWLDYLRGRRALAALAVCVLVAAAAPTGILHLSHLPGVWSLPARWTEARPGWLYRSGQIPAADVADVLREMRIDVVLDLTDEEPDPVRDAEQAAAEKLGVRYLHLPVVQPRSLVIANLARAVAEIERGRKRGDRVLVHCTYGHRRSAVALALYARLIEHEPPHVAFAEFSRYADADSTWSRDAQRFVDANIDEVRAQVAADLALPAPESH
ncbi:MAG TPA: dual specificity protein phosphatase [Myxococcota bacterium]|nr:dual specificity protein phosphatase [Myxococcota bacterium]